VAPYGLDLIAGLEKQRSPLAGPLVKVGELFAILAEGHDGRTLELPFREPTEAFVGEREPIAAFRVFARVDNVEADFTLAFDESSHGVRSRYTFRRWQAPHMRR
jgi:hypothetical protein